MKKTLSISLALLVAFGGLSLQAASAATVKAGATCTKVGITKVVSGKKFTCIKSGKKLVWNKGVKVPAPKPKPSATAAPIPQPPVITLDALDQKWTLKVALDSVNRKLALQPTTSLEPEMIYSPTVHEDEKKIERDLLAKSMKLFQDYFAPAKYRVVMFTNLDAQWADAALLTYGGTFPTKPSIEIERSSTGGRFCNFAIATRTSSGIPIYYECTDTRKIREWTNYQNPPHEYFHLVQHSLAEVRLPAWLLEGSAAFMGEAVGYAEMADPVALKMQQNINTGYDFDPDNKGFDPQRFRNWTRTADANEVKRIFKRLEATELGYGVGNKLAYYSLGSIATEALVATYGLDGFMKIWKELGSGKSFNDAFLSSFGLSLDSFYEKLTPYLNGRY